MPSVLRLLRKMMGISRHATKCETGEPPAQTRCPALSCTELTNLVLIAKGSFCCVYSALYKKRPVAVKCSRSDVDRAAANDALLTELGVLAHTRHPNIINVVGYGWNNDKEGSCIFLVLDLIEHGTLGDLLNEDKSNGLGLTCSVDLAIQLSRAMKYLELGVSNEYGILHRDLKPENIGISDGRIQLMDFGLARVIRTGGKLGEVYEMTSECGTLRYMAPEVAKGLHYNEKCEVYSFGLIFWQMITGSKPYDEFAPQVFLEDVIKGGLRPVIPEWCPLELAQLLQGMWHPNPSVRPSFEEIELALSIYVMQKKYT